MTFHNTIKDAIVNHKRIEITYQGKNDAAPLVRTVDPWLLAESKTNDTTAGETTLVGQQVSGGSGEHIAQYKFSGLRDVRVTDESASNAPTSAADASKWDAIHAQW